jgi:hypothetical protein
MHRLFHIKSTKTKSGASHHFLFLSAILILKIGFWKAILGIAFQKPILSFSAPVALKSSKLVS